MTKDEALKLAFEALTATMSTHGFRDAIDEAHDKAITAIEEVLAQPEHSCVACEGNPKGNNNPCSICGTTQPEQEPTWWLVEYHDWAREFVTKKPEESIAIRRVTALYTTPPQEQRSCDRRKPLTDEQVREIARQYALGLAFPYDGKTTPEMFARAIEAAHGIKG